jgi:hypothetical protein
MEFYSLPAGAIRCAIGALWLRNSGRLAGLILLCQEDCLDCLAERVGGLSKRAKNK